MAKAELLTFSSVLGLLTAPSSAYILLYSWLFGMSVWITFFGGVIAYKSLPRHQFGALQHKTFPIYFVLSITISSALIFLWTSSHPDVISRIGRPLDTEVAQVYALATVVLSQGLNYFFVGPLTSKIMFQRHKLEKEEGKQYNDAGVSDYMRSLNKQFATLHGVSSLANLLAVIALGFHGLWVGKVGVQGY